MRKQKLREVKCLPKVTYKLWSGLYPGSAWPQNLCSQHLHYTALESLFENRSKCHCQATYLLIGWKVQLCLFIRKSAVHQFTRKYKFRLMSFYFLQKWFFVFAWWINNTLWNFLKEQAPPVCQIHFIYHSSVTYYEWWVMHIGIEGLGSPLVWSLKAGCSSAMRFYPNNKHSFWVLAKTLYYCLQSLQKSQPCL